MAPLLSENPLQQCDTLLTIILRSLFELLGPKLYFLTLEPQPPCFCISLVSRVASIVL